ncbi:MAG: globin family protein [Rubrivivax sp.]
MSPDQIHLVRQSFALVLPIAPTAAALFYDNLFGAQPQLRSLFKGDMQDQGTKLMQMIGAAVGLLDRPQLLMPVLRQLGARHGGYGVMPAHYDAVGAALLKTLAQGLGAAFNTPTREAWTAMYTIVATTMIAAADEAARDAAAAVAA